MPELLPRTGKAIENYRNHLRQYPDTDPEILAYLTRHINGLICGEIEQEVTHLIAERLRVGYKDEESALFIPNLLKSRNISSIRNARVREIRDTLSSFSTAYRDKFNGLVSQTVGETGINRLSTAVQKRNDSSHGIPPVIEFQEVEETYRVAIAVIDAVRQTLQT